MELTTAERCQPQRPLVAIEPTTGEKHHLPAVLQGPQIGHFSGLRMQNAADPPKELHVVLALQHDDHLTVSGARPPKQTSDV